MHLKNVNCNTVNNTISTFLRSRQMDTHHTLLKLETHVKWKVTKNPLVNSAQEYLTTVKGWILWIPSPPSLHKV